MNNTKTVTTWKIHEYRSRFESRVKERYFREEGVVTIPLSSIVSCSRFETKKVSYEVIYKKAKVPFLFFWTTEVSTYSNKITEAREKTTFYRSKLIDGSTIITKEPLLY
jgi:hypothetical protein